ncbi:S-adenosyl-L-methionine-dependent methyltransferase [Lojkania enalia]|uniref:S-adenosyl-L-methionine-dependent methyltransferase n=1 Tax=Lojkania enalia TaxID=147567 RepID=A0A9P4K549_9PLEO|nr:S-adenosyl-L-methionine-dependent methyltransferase [Didymosphaeria enalia]
MADKNKTMQNGMSKKISSITDVLSDLNEHLRELTKSLHSEDGLPDPEHLQQAAQTINLLHKIQLILDPPVLLLADQFLGYVKTKCLCAAVERGMPDALSNGPMTLDELAKVSGSRKDRLGQILRILYNNGIFNFDASTETYSNNAASLLLTTGHWTQWHNWVTLYGNQFYDIARGIPDSTKRDATRWAAQINFDTDDNMFTYFTDQGWLPQLHRTLSGGAAAQMPGILEDYPWHEVANEVVMDIGGGGGGLIAGLLRKYPTMRGGIFDLPRVIDHVKPFFRSGGQYSDIGERVADKDLVAGDFFESVPRRKFYTIKWCIHDWKDPDAVKILNNIRKALVPEEESRLVVLESILTDVHSSRLSHYGDINMMMTANGQERTEPQWQSLAKLSGWKIERIYELRGAWVKAMDFRPVAMDTSSYTS